MRRLLAFAVVLAAGCSDAPPPVEVTPEPPLGTGDLQPLAVGKSWIYVGSLGERQVHSITKSEMVGPFECYVYEIRSGSTVQRLWVRAEKDGLKHYRTQLGDLVPVDLGDPVTQIPLPATLGTTWEYDDESLMEARCKGTVEALDTLNVPAGRFRCVRVRLIGSKDNVRLFERVAWYAPGVGLVREECTLNKGDGVERGSIALKERK